MGDGRLNKCIECVKKRVSEKYKVDKIEYHEGMSTLMMAMEKKTIALENLTVNNTKDIERHAKDIEKLVEEYRVLRDEVVKIINRYDPEKARSLSQFKFKDAD
jgi:hypothetical protein